MEKRRNIINAFVYLWIDFKARKFYIGSHKGTDDDGYVCSSKVMLEQYHQRPTDFVRMILMRGDDTNVRKWEEEILDILDVKNRPDFYNMMNGNGDFINKGGYILSETTRKRQSEAQKGNTKGKANKDKPKPWLIGNKFSKPHKKQHTENYLGNTNGRGGKGKSKSKEHIQKMSLSTLGRKFVNDGHVTKLVKPTELSHFLQNGFSLGILRGEIS